MTSKITWEKDRIVWLAGAGVELGTLKYIKSLEANSYTLIEGTSIDYPGPQVKTPLGLSKLVVLEIVAGLVGVNKFGMVVPEIIPKSK